MLSQSELAGFLIGLVKINDADLIDDDALLTPEICAADDRAAIRRLRDMIQSLYRDFDYLASREFAAMGNGKSNAYRAMLARIWNDPEKRTQKCKEFADAMAALLADDRAYDLTPAEHHKIHDQLRDGLDRLRIPMVTTRHNKAMHLSGLRFRGTVTTDEEICVCRNQEI